MTVKVLKALKFTGWAIDNDLTDALLSKAAREIEAGLVDARLGGFLLKKRIAAPGRGKRGGYRVVLAYRQGDRLIFLHGFAKNEQDNITKAETVILHQLAAFYMQANDGAITEMIEQHLIWEININEPNYQGRT